MLELGPAASVHYSTTVSAEWLFVQHSTPSVHFWCLPSRWSNHTPWSSSALLFCTCFNTALLVFLPHLQWMAFTLRLNKLLFFIGAELCPMSYQMSHMSFSPWWSCVAEICSACSDSLMAVFCAWKHMAAGSIPGNCSCIYNEWNAKLTLHSRASI